jgi:hypothetical protein
MARVFSVSGCLRIALGLIAAGAATNQQAGSTVMDLRKPSIE